LAAEDHRIGDEAALDHLAEARDEVGLGQRVEDVDVTEHAGGRVEGADEVLALGGVDAGLPADGRVDHPEQGGGHLHDAHAAQPRGCDEAGEVGDGATAHPDDRVGAGEAGSSELRPQVGGHGGRLGGLGVGHLGDVDGIPVTLERGGDPSRQPGQRRRVDDEHALDVRPEQLGHAVQHTGPDDDVVVATDGDRRRLGCTGHECDPSSRATTSSTTSAGVRPAVSTRTVATRS
jgi:hypothetical protein